MGTPANNNIQTCNQIGDFFGSNNYIRPYTKVFTLSNLPAHKIEIEFTGVNTPKWDPYDNFADATLNGNYFRCYTPYVNNEIKCTNINWYYWNCAITTQSNINTLTLTFTTWVNYHGVWGVRDLLIYQYLCDTSCKSCNGPLGTQCLSCYAFANLQSGVCTCIENYYYEELCSPPMPCASFPFSACKRCHISCKTCSGSGDDNCLSCFFTDVLKNGRCQPLNSIKKIKLAKKNK